MTELLNLTQIVPSVTQHCLSGQKQPVSSSRREGKPSSCQWQWQWQCKGKYMGSVCGQNSFLCTVSPFECFCLSPPATHFSCNLLRFFLKSSLLSCVFTLCNCSIQSLWGGLSYPCVHTASAGPLHIFIPGISSSGIWCLALLTPLTMLLQR